MATEIIVKIKDSQKSMTSKLKVYEPITADFTEPKIDDFLAKCSKNFGGDPLSNKVTVTLKLIED